MNNKQSQTIRKYKVYLYDQVYKQNLKRMRQKNKLNSRTFANYINSGISVPKGRKRLVLSVRMT